MKKELIMGVCVILFAAFSFFKDAQVTPLKKIGKDLYHASSVSVIKATDQQKIKAIIARQYGIKSFSTIFVIHYVPDRGTKRSGYAMADQLFGNAVFQQNIVEDGEPEEVTQRNMFSTNANNGAIGDILQVLSNYNIH